MSVEPQLPSAEVERIVPAAPADAFDAWLDEATLIEFICPAPGRAIEVAIDGRVGGTYRFLMSLPQRQLVVTGEYVALDRPERSHSHGAAQTPETSRVSSPSPSRPTATTRRSCGSPTACCPRA